MTNAYLPVTREYTEPELDLITARQIADDRRRIAALEAEKAQIGSIRQPDDYRETNLLIGVLLGRLIVATEQPERYRRQLRENLARGLIEARFLPEARQPWTCGKAVRRAADGQALGDRCGERTHRAMRTGGETWGPMPTRGSS